MIEVPRNKTDMNIDSPRGFGSKDCFRGWILLLCLLGFLQTVLAMTPQEAVDSFAKTPRLPAGSMAVMVSDLATGKILASYNIEKPLTPASIMKSVTIASLSDVSKPGSEWLTNVNIDGKIDGEGNLIGNLIVEGSGDPTINSTTWPKSEDFVEEIVEGLKKKGIKNIEGRILINESYFAGESIPASWASGDLAHAYGTGSHAFNFRNNASGKRAEKNPAGIFGNVLRKRLSESGITVKDSTLKEGSAKVLLTHKSAEMRDIMRSCMNRSDNLFAETFLRKFGKISGGDGSTADAAEREMEYWRKKRPQITGVEIVDGSGLSRKNKVTALFMENVLTDKKNDVDYVSYFPLAGQEGTLRKFLADTPLDSYIAMKTGSMSGIQCYAGYKLDDDFAPTHAVVVIVNNFTCDRAYLRKQIETLLLRVFGE